MLKIVLALLLAIFLYVGLVSSGSVDTLALEDPEMDCKRIML